MVSRDAPEFLALEYLDNMDPKLVYIASPYAHPSAEVREARLEAVRHVCGRMVNEGKIVMSPLVYLGELAYRGVHPPQGWYAFDLQLLARCDELIVLQLPGWEDSRGSPRGSSRRPDQGPPRPTHVSGGSSAARGYS